MAARDQKKGQITIMANNIRGVSHGQILEESKWTKNTAGGKHVQNGSGGGVHHNANRERKPVLELRVLKVDGPFDPETGKKVDVIEKEKKYNYKVIQYNRTPLKEELRNLKWGLKYDNGKIGVAPRVTGLETISYFVSKEDDISKLTVYAFFKKPNENACVKVDVKTQSYIIVVGTQNHSSSMARNFLLQDVGPGSKLMFVHQGLRRMRLNQNIKFDFLLCTAGYTVNQKNAIKEAVENKFKGKYVEVSSAKEIIKYINEGGEKSRKISPIKQLIIYSHGVVGEISLGLAPAGVDVTEYSFEKEEASRLKKDSFAPEANIYLFSCRSGIGNENIDRSIYINRKGSKTDPNNRYNIISSESIAQKIANSTKSLVHAYLRRTDYEETLFTTDELCFSDYMKIRNGNINIKPSNKCNKYSYLLDKKYKLTPAETKRWEEWKAIESNMKNIDDAWFDPDGARNNVKAAPSPEGVPADMKTFKPM